MCLALEIYELNISMKPLREIYDMIEEYAGCTPEQLNNALELVKKQRKTKREARR